MIAISLADLLRQSDDMCEVCQQEPFGFVVTFKFKPEARVKHSNPQCECDTKPLKAHMCGPCKDKTLHCASGQCEEGKACEVESIKIQTDIEAVDEHLAVKAVELGTSSEALRFGMAYRMDAREAQTVLTALEKAGIPVDFKVMRPRIGEGVRTYGGSGSGGEHSPSADGSGGMAAESSERTEASRSPEPGAWPRPIFAVPNDGNVH